MGAFSLCDGVHHVACCDQDGSQGSIAAPSPYEQQQLLAAHARAVSLITPWQEEAVAVHVWEEQSHETSVAVALGSDEDSNDEHNDENNDAEEENLGDDDIKRAPGGSQPGRCVSSPPPSSTGDESSWEATPVHNSSRHKRGADIGSVDTGSRNSASSSSSSSGKHPVLHYPQMLKAIRLLKNSRFKELPVPLPRWQEIKEEWFGLPTSMDMVVAVSHGWRNQTHPDPNGWKREVVSRLLESVETGGEVYVFMDFVSIPQRPFLVGQPNRTPEEQKTFTTALRWMHKMYFLADRVIHLGYRDEKVSGEGKVYYVPLSTLDGAQFALLDDWVQIVGMPNPLWHQPEEHQKRWSLFDRVLMVGNIPIYDTTRLMDLLSDASCRHLLVTCVRFPHGRVNDTPADERGWVFLERFITACKVSMLPGQIGEKVIITDTPEIKEEIISYANMLRKAVEQDKASGSSTTPNLKMVMTFFQEELSRKSFSASSTDKFLIDQEVEVSEIDRRQSVVVADREVVTGIMKEFAAHLSAQWNLEQAAQRTRAHALADRLKEYWYGWNHFSQEFYCELCERQPWWPMVLLVLLQAVPWASIHLLDYGSPLQDFSTQGLYVAYYVPLLTIVSLGSFGFATGEAIGIRTTLWQSLRYLAWSSCNMLWVLMCILFQGRWIGVFPIPLGMAKGVLASTLAMPFLALTIPRSILKDKESQIRIAWHLGNAGVAQLVSGVIQPHLNSMLRHSRGDLTHMGFICLFLIVKLSYEKLGEHLYPRVGADSMPIIVFCACTLYELNLCIAMSSGFSAAPFLLLLLIDAVENGYHLWCLHRECKARGAQQRHAAMQLNNGDARFAPISERQHAFILCSLLIREFVECSTVLVFILEVSLAYYVAPKNNGLVCRFRPEDFQRMIQYLVVDLVVECAMAVLTWYVVVSHGFKPLAILRGIIARYFAAFLPMACASHVYLLGQSHSHNGMDLTYEFPWTHGNAEWICGLTYRARL